MLGKLVLPLACLLLLCSCDGISLAGTESLLEAPKLNKRQVEITAALETTLNLENIELEYPQRGEYRSPFVFFDMDGDGLEEAIVFYSNLGDTAGNARARILRQSQPGAWVSIKDLPSDRTQIDFVQFRHILDRQSYCMVLGWKGQGQKAAKLDICSVSDGAVRPEASQEYQLYIIKDFDGDGLDEALTVGKESSAGRFGVRMLHSFAGRLRREESLLLAKNADGILAIRHGSLWDGSSAVYIDMALSTGANIEYGTEIVRVTSDGPHLLAGDAPDVAGEPSAERLLFESTLRVDEVLSADFDGDGAVEIPMPIVPSGDDEQELPSGGEGPRLYRFMQLAEEGFSEHATGVINADDGYTLFFPERWGGRITVQIDGNTGEWRFFEINPDTQEPGAELLRIRRNTARGVVDVFEKYLTLGERGADTFSCYIPTDTSSPPNPLSVTGDEIRDLFFLNSQS